MRSRVKRAHVAALVVAALLVLGAGLGLYRERRTLVFRACHVVRALAVTPGGLLAVGTDLATVELWDLAEGKRVFAAADLDRDGSPVIDVEFSGDGRSVIGLAQGRHAVVLDGVGHVTTSIAPRGDDLTLGAISPSGDTLALRTSLEIELHPLGRAGPVRTLGPWEPSVPTRGSVVFSRGGDLVATCEVRGAWIWSTATGALVARHAHGDLDATVLAPTPGGGFLWARSFYDRANHHAATVELRALPADTLVATLDLGKSFPLVEALALSPDGDLVAVSLVRLDSSGMLFEAAEVRLVRVADGAVVATYRSNGPPDMFCRALAFWPGRNRLVGAWGNEVHVWSYRH